MRLLQMKNLPLFTLLMKITFCSPFFFQMLLCISTISKFILQMHFMHTSPTFPANSRMLLVKKRRSALRRVWMNKLFLRTWTESCLSFFCLSGMKEFIRPVGLMLYVCFGFILFCNSAWLYPKMKDMLQLIRARSMFQMINNNPNFNLGNINCSNLCPRNALKDDYHMTKMETLA